LHSSFEQGARLSIRGRPRGSRPLSVLFVSREYPPETGGGGIGSYVQTIAPALAQRGHEVHVLSCVDGQATEDRSDEAVHVHRRGVRRILPKVRRRFPATALRVEGAVGRYLDYRRLRTDFDVIEYPDWFAEGLIFAALHTRPLVVHLHTPLGLVERHNPRSFRWTPDRRLANRLERLPLRRADVITSPSLLLADDLAREGWIRGREPWIIRYPVDLAPWANVRPALDSPPRVLMVGRLEGRKAPEVLVRAAAALAPEIPDFEAVFVGRPSLRDGGSYRDWLADLAAELRAPCRFVEQVDRDDLARWYGSCRVVALPSRYDNFPYVGLEAMASARPVVCTEQTGTAEIVRGTGAGAVVTVDDVGGLVHGLRPFLLDSRASERAGREARSIVARECSPDQIAEQREACYLEAIRLWSRRVSRRPPDGTAAAHAGGRARAV
jgi:glycogen synthase